MDFEWDVDIPMESAEDGWKYIRECYRQHTLATLSTRVEGDICVSLSKGTNVAEWSNQESIHKKSKILYKLRKRGHIVLQEYNNEKVKMPDGKTYYMFVVQHTDSTKDTEDVFAKAQRLIVKGNVYFFTRKANRDALYKYIMGV